MKKTQSQISERVGLEKEIKELRRRGFIPSKKSETACVKCRTCIGCQPFSDSGEELKTK